MLSALQTTGTVIGDALGVAALCAVVRWVVGQLSRASHTTGVATGDPQLAAALDEAVRGHHTRSVAAAVVTTDAPPRFCYIDADADTSFEIGSLSKALTGLLVADRLPALDLAEDTPLSALDPECEGALGTITVQQLATHTSGLPKLPRSPLVFGQSLAFTAFGTNPYAGSTIRGLRRAAARAARRATPGRFDYSNLGAAALGQAIAHADNRTYADSLATHILGPLQMTRTTVNPPRGGVHAGWTRDGRQTWPWRLGGYAPAGGVVSTITDMARLAQSVLGRTAPGQMALQERHRTSEQSGIGLFWMLKTVDGQHIHWHNGETGGYSSYLGVNIDRGRAVVVLASVADSARQQQIADALIRTSQND
ncbi:CubicO group peptidase (beta-lactamase class C family) [Rudaeicoccus suwonensis]|uniref:Beta-lactamase n=2 Tax=Rudaeicoccus suwonensis TaxID=657409 RepID=A0A561E782_9MICO|nr:CubicO group peptidase (beta-lactamase class C family) [Rudaeicoccus suwonensis]